MHYLNRLKEKRAKIFATIALLVSSLLAFHSISIVAHAQQDLPVFETVPVTIPNGAANPAVDITFQNLANWYEPKKLTISSGDVDVWKNEDTEPHTVTSGRGSGIASVQTNEKGDPDGIFDSKLFAPGESWSHAFYTPGAYSYFCTIHPWMEGVVTVNAITAEEMPGYPVDASGNRYER